MSTREFIRGEASLTPSLEGHVTRMGSVTTGQDRCVCVCVCVCVYVWDFTGNWYSRRF